MNTGTQYKKLYEHELGIDYALFDALPETAFEKVLEWLRPEGVQYFQSHFDVHGDLVSLHILGGGMQVRNFIKFEGEFKKWDQNALDNLWQDVVLKAIWGSKNG